MTVLMMVIMSRSDGEELDSQGDASSQPDTISIASRTSQNTLDSDKVGTHTGAPQGAPVGVLWDTALESQQMRLLCPAAA